MDTSCLTSAQNRPEIKEVKIHHQQVRQIQVLEITSLSCELIHVYG